MAVKFLTNEYCYLASASWLDSITACSVRCRVRFDTVGAGSQFIFRHRNGTTGDQISARKDSGGKLRWSVTAGGVSSTRDSVFTPSAGAIYDLVMTWQQGQATGMFLYLDGVLDSSGSSTTTQGTYNTSGGDLYIGARKATPATEYGQCTLEEFAIWAGVVLDAERAAALAGGDWPHQLGVSAPAIDLPMYPDQLATLIDRSGNDRKIVDGNSGGSPASDIVGGALQDPLGLLGDPMPDDLAWIGAGGSGSGGAPPNPWTLWTPDVQENQTSVVLSGLTNSVAYEFKANFIDDQGNISADSNIAEATPTSVTSSVVAPAPWRRTRYLTKYRSGS